MDHVRSYYIIRNNEDEGIGDFFYKVEPWCQNVPCKGRFDFTWDVDKKKGHVPLDIHGNTPWFVHGSRAWIASHMELDNLNVHTCGHMAPMTIGHITSYAAMHMF